MVALLQCEKNTWNILRVDVFPEVTLGKLGHVKSGPCSGKKLVLLWEFLSSKEFGCKFILADNYLMFFLTQRLYFDTFSASQGV